MIQLAARQQKRAAPWVFERSPAAGADRSGEAGVGAKITPDETKLLSVARGLVAMRAARTQAQLYLR
jgi:hypothetical protein